jgi:hypothetical protein
MADDFFRPSYTTGIWSAGKLGVNWYPFRERLLRVNGELIYMKDSPIGYYDAHVHLTNYIQEGITARQYLDVVGDRVQRSVLFGIPLQMHWSHRVTGDIAPTY